MTTFTEKRMNLEGIPIHYAEGGQGFPIVLLHGSGPGAASKGAWPLVLEPLAERFHVYAMDLIGFGMSGRKPAPPYFDVPLWLRQLQAFIEHIDPPELGIVGHSLSGALALKAASSNRRITHVLTTCSAGGATRLGAELDRIWTFPKNRQELKRAVEDLLYDAVADHRGVPQETRGRSVLRRLRRVLRLDVLGRQAEIPRPNCSHAARAIQHPMRSRNDARKR